MAFIDWIKEEDRGSLCAFVILECMSKVGIEKFGNFDSSKLEVEMKINGIDVDFKQCMDYIDSQIDDFKARVKDEVQDDVKRDLIFKLENM